MNPDILKAGLILLAAAGFVLINVNPKNFSRLSQIFSSTPKPGAESHDKKVRRDVSSKKDRA